MTILYVASPMYMCLERGWGGGGPYKLPTRANFVDLGKVENIFYVIGPNGICLPGG